MSTDNTNNGTPERYIPDDQPYDDKDWLYEQYWGTPWRSAREMAKACDTSRGTIQGRMEQFGVPKRPEYWKRSSGSCDVQEMYALEDTDESVDWNIVVNNETVVDTDV
jgi:hypothetical protein